MDKKKLIGKVERELIAAHLGRPKADPGENWNFAVMAEIRRQSRPPFIAQNPAVTLRFFWRFATAAGISAVILTSYAFGTGLGLEQLLFNFFFDDPLAAQAFRLLSL